MRSGLVNSNLLNRNDKKFFAVDLYLCANQVQILRKILRKVIHRVERLSRWVRRRG